MTMHQPDEHASEQLSAGIDGELSREEWRFLLRRFGHDEDLQLRWTRYHVASASLRKQLPPLATGGFAARVMLAIEQDGAVVVAAAPRYRWLRWSAGGAIAAGVAAAALMMTQPTGEAGRHATSHIAEVAPSTMTPAAAPSASPTEVAVVPTWLSGKMPGRLSQRASITLGATPLDVSYDGASTTPYGGDLSPFRAQRYRTLDNHDGSYLILLDPNRQQVPDAPRQAASAH